MRELSLFTGIGGGLLGTRCLGWRCVGAVEWDKFCFKILRYRIAEGILDECPTYCLDIQEFLERGLADSYTDLVDIITAGFPCQPFSVAGLRGGGADRRNTWPQTIEIIRRVRPRFVFLENVPGLRYIFRQGGVPAAASYIGRVFADLAESGFDVGWKSISGAELGVAHKRERIWIAGFRTREAMADDTRFGMERLRTERLQEPDTQIQEVLFGRGSNRIRWWERETAQVESGLVRLADGVPYRVDQLRALGNAEIPFVASAAWTYLERFLQGALECQVN